MKIIRASISAMPQPMPRGMFDPLPIVTVHYADGSSEKLFAYFPDEVELLPEDFVGLTRAQAIALKFTRQKEQSA